MSQTIEAKADAAEARTHETRGFIQQVRVAARCKYTPEEKVRIVLERFRWEVAVRGLCRREFLLPFILDPCLLPCELIVRQVVGSILKQSLSGGF